MADSSMLCFIRWITLLSCVYPLISISASIPSRSNYRSTLSQDIRFRSSEKRNQVLIGRQFLTCHQSHAGRNSVSSTTVQNPNGCITGHLSSSFKDKVDVATVLEEASKKWKFRYASVAERRSVAEAFMRKKANKLPPLRIVLLGKPASGKGTIAPMISAAFRVTNIGTGNLLRSEVRTKSELGRLVAEIMDKGGLLPDDLMSALISKRAAEYDAVTNGWLLDGYPRTINQARDMITRDLAPDAVLILDRPDELCRAMTLGRMSDSATGAIYHPVYSPPPEGIEHRLVWRLDDNDDALEKRLADHQRSIDDIMTIFDRATEHQIDVKSFDNSRSELETFAEITRFLEEVAEKKAVRIATEAETKRVDGESYVYLDSHDAAMAVSKMAKAMELQRREAKDPFMLEAAGADDDVPAMCGLGEDAEACELRLGETWLQNVGTNDALLAAVERCNTYDATEYAPVFVGETQIGFVSKEMLDKLRSFSSEIVEIALNPYTFAVRPGGEAEQGVSNYAVYLAPMARDSYERTSVIGALVDGLVLDEFIPPEKIRDEKQDVYPLGSGVGATVEPLLRLERAAITYLGVSSYGVHVNGYVIDEETGAPAAMWVGKRALSKPTYPGLLDQMVAGGQPSGLSFRENVRKECIEEASLPPSSFRMLKAAGLVSYRYGTKRGLSTKSLAIFDLPMPRDLIPSNSDGEVQEFTLMTMDEIISSLKYQLPLWKPNSALVAVDFLIRHGFIGPDDPKYFEICHLLRSAALPKQ